MSGLLWEIFEPLVRAIRPQAPRKPLTVKRPPRSVGQATAPILPFPSAPLAQPPTKPAASSRVRKPRPIAPPARRKPNASNNTDASMQARYDAVVALMLEKYQIRVRKWRTSMSGIAWYVTYRDGRIQRLIEAPRPKGPMSVAVFLHEIGHHAIGFDVYKPRCLEEFHAWRWALEAMHEHNLNISDQVKLRVHRSLWYAVQKAKRRGIKSIPTELTPYLEKPIFASRRSKR